MRGRSHVEDHPEDLIDLARSGLLDAARWGELNQHLESCAPCFTHVRVAGIRNVDSPPKPNTAPVRDRMTVATVIGRWELAQSRRRSSRVRRWVAGGAGVVLLSSAAMAATLWAIGQKRSDGPVLTLPPHRTLERATVPNAIEAAPAPPEAPPPKEAPAASEVKARPASSELFDRACDLGRRGNTVGALATFRRLQRLYPDSRENHLAPLVIGRMWLENGRPDRAAPRFAQYVRSGGAGAVEALVGHATALRRMKRYDEEAADWKTLLDKYPGSLYAADARKRLDDLRGQSAGGRRSGVP